MGNPVVPALQPLSSWTAIALNFGHYKLARYHYCDISQGHRTELGVRARKNTSWYNIRVHHGAKEQGNQSSLYNFTGHLGHREANHQVLIR